MMWPAIRPSPWPVTAARHAQAATFMRLPPALAPAGRDAVVIGAPYDAGTSHRPGARLAPSAIRHESCLIYGAGGPNVLDGIDVVDGGDIALAPLSRELAMANATIALSGLLRANAVFLMLGGDHSLSLPGIRAVHERHGPLAVLRLHAHHHGPPFRQGLEEGLIHGPSMIQIGTREQAQSPDFWRAHGVTTVPVQNCAGECGVRRTAGRIREVAGDRPLYVYVSVDVAVADPAFAPGTGTPAPGGLSTRAVLALLGIVGELNPVGFDVVGVCPPFDPSGITALLAAEIGALLLHQYSRAHVHQRPGRSER
jgi:arginase family enzyme